MQRSAVSNQLSARTSPGQSGEVLRFEGGETNFFLPRRGRCPAGAEGASTGSAVYSLGTTAPATCFVSLEGTVSVLSADDSPAAVDGTPITFRHRGLVSPEGFTPLDESRPLWVMENWCEEGGAVRVEVNDVTFDQPAAGRCDAPDGKATIRNPS